jgi:[protein-PII] uridylyltransferase
MTTSADEASRVEHRPLLERVSPALVAELRHYLGIHRAEVEAAIRLGDDGSGLAAATRHAKAYDGLLCSLFHAARAALSREDRWHEVSLAAVGSYGRGAVAYGSDLDVRLLTASEPTRVAPIAEALLYPLWDSGVSVGHQVVTEAELIELAKTDLPTATSLLDWRPLAGGAEATNALVTRAFESVFSESNLPSFLERLTASSDERGARFGASVYLLEPDVKHGAGGVRELDVCHWIARARWGVADLKALVRVGVLVPRELAPLEAAASFLWRVRNQLHLQAGRRSDRLSFDRQEQVAVALGYGSGGPAIERFMSDYYRHARGVILAREMLTARALPAPKKRLSDVRVEGGLKLTNGAVSFEHSSQLDLDPAIALRVYDEAVRRDLPVYAYARDAIARACSLPSFCERLRASEEAAKLFTRLVSVVQPTRLRSRGVAAELHDVGLLLAMVPEFSPVVGRVHHDIYHVYTVDVHSVAAVERLAALCRGELAAEFPFASRLAAEMARPNVVFFACLLHDVGKDIGGRHHAERGFELAGVILRRLGWAEADVAEVQHLVLKHLRMYHVATRRDLDDPATLDEFSRDVHGREGLRELYLLTVADVSTTSPTAMNGWKARMLEELYVATDARLAQGTAARGRSDADARRRAVRALRGKRSSFLEHFLQAMPERYLYANSAAEVSHHAEVLQLLQKRDVAVERFATEGAHARIGIVADDRPGLLAMIAATLAGSRLPVMSAEIHSFVDSKHRRRAFDLFWVRLPEGVEAELIVARLERDLTDLIAGRERARDLVEARRNQARLAPRPQPPVPTEVHVDNRASEQHTVIEVTTRDRPGLLFTLADALLEAEVEVHLAKINTEGSRVADVFYVTERDHQKLSHGARSEQVKAALVRAVEQLVEL